jgi:hypothetical protein
MELSLEKLRYALSKQIWSRTQNFRATEFAMLERKCFLFRQLYCTKRPQGSQLIADLALSTGTVFVPRPCGLTFEIQKGD